MNTILSRAADILDQPNAWTQDSLAKDSEGAYLNTATSPNACQWCALGAMLKASNNTDINAAANKLKQVIGMGDPFYSISSWNDDPARTQAEVVAALREAAAL